MRDEDLERLVQSVETLVRASVRRDEAIAELQHGLDAVERSIGKVLPKLVEASMSALDQDMLDRLRKKQWEQRKQEDNTGAFVHEGKLTVTSIPLKGVWTIVRPVIFLGVGAAFKFVLDWLRTFKR